MSLQTKFNLSEETVEKLQKLIRYNIDSYEGFQKSAEEIENPHLASLFQDLAHERSALATELQEYVEWNHEEAEEDGSALGAVHRAWIGIRGKLSDGDAYTVLSETERGEDAIQEAYEEVLEDLPGNALGDVIRQQYARIKAAHDRIRDLRNHYKGED